MLYMDAIIEAIKPFVEAEDRQIERINADISKLEAELDKRRNDLAFAMERKAAYELVIAGRGQQCAATSTLDTWGRSSSTVGGSKPVTLIAAHSSRKPLSETWRTILRYIGRDAKTIDDVVEFAASSGMNIQRNNVRSQVWNLSSKLGYLEKLGTGQFTLTDTGAEACGLQEGEAPSGANTEGILFNPPAGSGP